MNRKNSQGGSSFAYHHTLLERSPDTCVCGHHVNNHDLLNGVLQCKLKYCKSKINPLQTKPQVAIDEKSLMKERNKTAETRKGCGKYYDTWEGDIEIKCGDDLLNGHPILCPECKGEK